MQARTLRRSLQALLVFTLLAGTAWRGGAAVTAQAAPGVVYTMTNATAGNAVIQFDRAADGTLTPAGTFPTGGLGTGDILGGVQGPLILSQDGSRLFAVNGGSDDISVFAVERGGLTLVDKVPSGGSRPGSLTIFGNLLYVLNTRGSGNLTGFNVGMDGTLTPLLGSARPLSGAATTSPAQVQFSRDGRLLVVTEKATGIIVIYQVGADGQLDGLQRAHANGVTPFGFTFTERGYLLVSEAWDALDGKGAASSYTLASTGVLGVINGSVPLRQTETCWLVLTSNGRYAYLTNFQDTSNSVSSYRVAEDGTLTLLQAVAGRTGDGPRDEALSRESQYLYTVNFRDGTISAFAVQPDGGLVPLRGASVPVGSLGLAAK